MQKYAVKPMEELATELSAGLVRLRKGYVDAAEALVKIIDPAGEYPYEFIVYRLTGYRPGPRAQTNQPLPGKVLRNELLKMMLDICDSFDFQASDYSEHVYDVPALARKLSISTKTIQRWRRQGLPARRLVFPGGKRRLAFLVSSVEWFCQGRKGRVVRSSRFSQMTTWERNDILRRARRMANFTKSNLNEIARRIAARTGRALETIRYTIRKHDMDHPDEAIFPEMTAPLDRQERSEIYHNYLNGAPAATLARQYRRTRGSIYRIINEMRAAELLDRPINYVYNSQFDLPNADELILSEGAGEEAPSAVAAAKQHLNRSPAEAPLAELPPYLKSLYEVPLLDSSAERRLFRRYNYLKYKADKLRKKIDVNRVRTNELKEIESLLLQANAVKNRIIRANLRLVVSIAKKHVGGPQSLFELISDGNVSLMRAVEKFDYMRGNRFSTYASWAIMRNFARSVPRERYRLERLATGQEETIDIESSLKTYAAAEINIPELRESIDAILSQLPPLERSILIDHYGLDEASESKTLDQLGRRLGVSKERVRQIEIKALKKLRKILLPRKSDLLS